MYRTRTLGGSAALVLVLAMAACDTVPTSTSAPGAPSLLIAPTAPTRDTVAVALAETARVDTTPQVFGPPEGTRSRDVGDDTFNLDFWVDGRHITHRVRTLTQDARTVERTGKPDLIFEWAILDDMLYGSLYGSDDFIGIIGEDRNNDGMISYPSEVIGFWGRCTLATNQTYSKNDPATGKPRWIHWENYDSDEEEMYHYIFDPVTNNLKIFHRHEDGRVVQVYDGPPIKDPGKMPPPDPQASTTTGTTTTTASTPGTTTTASTPGTTTGTTTAPTTAAPATAPAL